MSASATCEYLIIMDQSSLKVTILEVKSFASDPAQQPLNGRWDFCFENVCQCVWCSLQSASCIYVIIVAYWFLS